MRLYMTFDVDWILLHGAIVHVNVPFDYILSQFFLFAFLSSFLQTDRN